MAEEIVMPRLSDTMERGTIARWLVHEGDAVHEGDVLAEIETDKATMELNAYSDGVLLRILVQDGEAAELGAPIAVVGAEGEDASGFSAAAGNGDAARPRSGGAAARPATSRDRRAPRRAAAGAPAPAPAAEAPAPQPPAGDSRPARSPGGWHPTPASTCAAWPARAVAPTVASCASTSSARWPAATAAPAAAAPAAAAPAAAAPAPAPRRQRRRPRPTP